MLQVTSHPSAVKDLAKQQRRVVRRLLRDLVALAGPVLNTPTRRPRKASTQRLQQRLLYRRADSLSDSDLDQLVREIGADRLMRALDRWSQPSLIAAE